MKNIQMNSCNYTLLRTIKDLSIYVFLNEKKNSFYLSLYALIMLFQKQLHISLLKAVTMKQVAS